MKNKEQLLYFFLQNKISLSQYDYKFMANLQTMIQNQNRVTSNQATLFDNLISKYKKQLTKHGLVKEELKLLPWKTMVVESTPEYTGATVSLIDDTISIRVPFNKQFISSFRNIKNNTFEWNKDNKTYTAKFNTNAFKIAYTVLPEYFPSVRYNQELQDILDELNKYASAVWYPTLRKINDSLVVVATNEVLGNLLQDINLEPTPKTFFKLSTMGITVDPELYADNTKLEFSANQVSEIEITELETAIRWMKEIGCQHVVIGRGLRTLLNQDSLTNMIEKYGMNSLGPMSYGSLPDGVSMLIQHTSNIDVRQAFQGKISKTVVIKDSRPVEVK